MMIVMMSLSYHLLAAVVSSVVCVVCVLAMQWSPVSLSCKYNNRATPTYISYNAHTARKLRNKLFKLRCLPLLLVYLLLCGPAGQNKHLFGYSALYGQVNVMCLVGGWDKILGLGSVVLRLTIML